MTDHGTNIGWTHGYTEAGARVAASRVGVPFDVFWANLSTGALWCVGCCEFHLADAFRQRRPDARGRRGRNYLCRVFEKRLREGVVQAPQARPPKVLRDGETVHQRYYRENRDRVKARARLRTRLAKRLPRGAAELLLERTGGLCAYCPAPATTWDHLVPISRGGRTEPGNVVPACKPCNSSKKDRDLHEWLDRWPQRVTERLADILVLRECYVGW